MTRSKTCYFPFNVLFFFCQSLSSATIILPQSRLIKNCSLFLVIPVHANQLDSGVLLVYSALFCCNSTSFRYIPVPFSFRCHSVLFQSHSALFRHIPVYSALFVSFRVIPVSFRLLSVYSGTIIVHSVSFRCHSASFRYIPVYSGIFRSVPVFSNARVLTHNGQMNTLRVSVNCLVVKKN